MPGRRLAGSRSRGSSCQRAGCRQWLHAVGLLLAWLRVSSSSSSFTDATLLVLLTALLLLLFVLLLLLLLLQPSAFVCCLEEHALRDVC